MAVSGGWVVIPELGRGVHPIEVASTFVFMFVVTPLPAGFPKPCPQFVAGPEKDGARS
jgi:hypothetical protein